MLVWNGVASVATVRGPQKKGRAQQFHLCAQAQKGSRDSKSHLYTKAHSRDQVEATGCPTTGGGHTICAPCAQREISLKEID